MIQVLTLKVKVLKKYGDHNSSDPAVMKMIFEDMKSLAPTNSYGAILWSHATNWVPANLGQLKHVLLVMIIPKVWMCNS